MEKSEIKKLPKYSEDWDYKITESSKKLLLKYIGKRVMCKELGLAIVDSIQYKEKRKNIGTYFNKKWKVVKVLTTVTLKTTNDLFETRKVEFASHCGMQTAHSLADYRDAYKRIMKQFEILPESKK